MTRLPSTRGSCGSAARRCRPSPRSTARPSGGPQPGHQLRPPAREQRRPLRRPLPRPGAPPRRRQHLAPAGGGRHQAVVAMVLFGQILSGEEAAAAGLVYRCVPADELLPVALSMAARAASFPRQLVRRTKETVRAMAGVRELDDAVALEWPPSSGRPDSPTSPSASPRSRPASPAAERTARTVTYTHGHHPSVLRSHTWRTAENSCAYLLPWLQHGDSLLDVGCGPAPSPSTSRSAWRRAPSSPRRRHLRPARRNGAAGDRGDPRGLLRRVGARPAFDDTSVDVVHAIRCSSISPTPSPRSARWRGCCDPVASSPCATPTSARLHGAPADPLLDRWLELYHEVTAENAPWLTRGATCSAGPRAGRPRGRGDFDVHVTFAIRSAAWWGGLWPSG